MSLESVTAAMRARVGDDSGLRATVRFDFGADGVLFLDAEATPNVVTNEDREARCTIGVSLADFEAIMTGDLDATEAFMSGRLKVDGDMAVAMRLAEVL